jgi:uncharacterized protein
MTDMPPPSQDPSPINYASGPAGGYMGPPPSQEDKTLAIVAHLISLVAPILGPLIIWLVKKDSSPFVADQAKEALNFQITLLIATIPAALLVCVGIGVFLLPVIGIVGLVLAIIAAVETSKGVAYRYPATLRLIK